MNRRDLDPGTLAERILTGDLDATDPEVQTVLRAHPALRTEVEELLAIQRQVESVSSLEREVLTEAGVRPDTVPVPPGGGGIPTSQLQRRRRSPWSLLLAATLAVVSIVLLLRAAAPTVDPTLGAAGRIRVERVESGLVLRWDGDLDRGQYYVVTLRHPDTGVELGRSPALHRAEWNLPDLTPPPLSSVAVEIATRDATPMPVGTSRARVAVPR